VLLSPARPVRDQLSAIPVGSAFLLSFLHRCLDALKRTHDVRITFSSIVTDVVVVCRFATIYDVINPIQCSRGFLKVGAKSKFFKDHPCITVGEVGMFSFGVSPEEFIFRDNGWVECSTHILSKACVGSRQVRVIEFPDELR
jgi:hypothetical protein